LALSYRSRTHHDPDRSREPSPRPSSRISAVASLTDGFAATYDRHVEVNLFPDRVLAVLTRRPCSRCAQQVFTRDTPPIRAAIGVPPVVTPPISFWKLIDLAPERLSDAIAVIAPVLT
jgi:hypothetical protein